MPFKFDWTIHAGHVLTALTLIGALAAAGINFDYRLKSMETSMTGVTTAMARITTLVEMSIQQREQINAIQRDVTRNERRLERLERVNAN